MASSASLKRRLSGGQTRNDDYLPTALDSDPSVTSPSRNRTLRDRGRAARNPVDQAREIRRASAELRTVDSAPSTPDTVQAAASSVSKSSSWSWAQRTWSYLAPEADQSSPPSQAIERNNGVQGFEGFNVVKRAADGIASTATAMATSLDTTVEQLFQGWTPAPPASDQLTAPRHRPHRLDKQAAVEQAGQTAGVRAADDAQTAHTDGWDDWGSSFGSRSPSPDMLPNEQATPMATWSASPRNTHKHLQQQQQPSVSSATHQACDRQGEDSCDPQPSCSDRCACKDSSAAGVAGAAREQRNESESETTTPTVSRQQVEANSVRSPTGLPPNIGSEPTTQSQQAGPSEAASPERDPLADQMAGQMQALLAEKARLAQENDRLARENTGLQELLQYTIHQHLPEPAEGLDEWATLDSALPEGEPIPGVENGSPLTTPR